ncbi:hypothetical protein G6L37_00535 [Agrobacterium rubi]|nr:hypothetical protein [Agrobacterium rubi]NTF23876.1 hypothetical protein [Agrobacterium rubi]
MTLAMNPAETQFGLMPRSIQRKIPSDAQLSSRRENAARIANKIADLISSGHKVYDDKGDQVLQTVVGKGGDVIFTFVEGGNTVMFMNDKNYDDGAMTPIPEFNASFSGWTYLHPRDIKPLEI